MQVSEFSQLSTPGATYCALTSKISSVTPRPITTACRSWPCLFVPGEEWGGGPSMGSDTTITDPNSVDAQNALCQALQGSHIVEGDLNICSNSM